MRRLLVLVALLLSLPAQAVTIEWVRVGEPYNPPDTTNCSACGSVSYGYYISKYEVTNAQYTEFLNAKAASDPLGLYNTGMGSDATFGGITQSGVSGSYTYTVEAGFANKPVTYVSFYDSLRFSNWLNNGQGIGDTETGAYTLVGAATPSNGLTVTRNPGAITFLPNDDEWYKAAYYDPALPGYYDYPAGTDTPTTCATPGATPNTANCQVAVDALTDVGSYSGSVSPYGTFDQGGNVEEWNETIVVGSLPLLKFRRLWGGSWESTDDDLAGAFPGFNPPSAANNSVGFRVASLVPEPDAGLLGMTAVLGLAANRRQRAS
jgi:formylglycine-generating enzyme required for sulfatase activity